MLPEHEQLRGYLIAQIEPFLVRIVMDEDVLDELVDLGNDVIIDGKISLGAN